MTMLSSSQVTLAVIAKTPLPGFVKTRLSPPCTPEQAAAIAMAALRDTLDAVLGAGCTDCSAQKLSVEDPTHQGFAEVRQRIIVLDGEPGWWIPDGFAVIPQRGEGLDERLAAAFEDIQGAVIIIGMDTPQISSFQLDHAVAELCSDGVDAVLGPAKDGGYWLIGLRETTQNALLGVPMSTPITGAAQLQRLQELGLNTTVLVELADVDTFDEALQVSELVPGSRFASSVAVTALAIAQANELDQRDLQRAESEYG